MTYNMKISQMSNTDIKNFKNTIRGELFVFFVLLEIKKIILNIVTGSDFFFTLDNT